jgi:hypothetical protein
MLWKDTELKLIIEDRATLKMVQERLLLLPVILWRMKTVLSRNMSPMNKVSLHGGQQHICSPLKNPEVASQLPTTNHYLPMLLQSHQLKCLCLHPITNRRQPLATSHRRNQFLLHIQHILFLETSLLANPNLKTYQTSLLTPPINLIAVKILNSPIFIQMEKMLAPSNQRPVPLPRVPNILHHSLLPWPKPPKEASDPRFPSSDTTAKVVQALKNPRCPVIP